MTVKVFYDRLFQYPCTDLTIKAVQGHNCHNFADDIFKCIFLIENARIAPKVRINSIIALVQIMAWPRPGDKSSSEPMVISLLMHICVTRPQWINNHSQHCSPQHTCKARLSAFSWALDFTGAPSVPASGAFPWPLFCDGSFWPWLLPGSFWPWPLSFPESFCPWPLPFLAWSETVSELWSVIVNVLIPEVASSTFIAPWPFTWPCIWPWGQTGSSAAPPLTSGD